MTTMTKTHLSEADQMSDDYYSQTSMFDDYDAEKIIKFDGVAPPGSYLVRVTDAEETITQKGQQMLKVDMEIVTGEHRGGTLKDWLVPSAHHEPQRRLAELVLATGNSKINSADTLIGTVVVVKIGEPDDGFRNPKILSYSRKG